MTTKIGSDEDSLDELYSMLNEIFAEEIQIEAKRKTTEKVVEPERLNLFVESFKKCVGYDKPFNVFTKNILFGLGEETTKVIKERVPREGEFGEDGLPIIDKVEKTVEIESLPAYVKKALDDAGFDVKKIHNNPVYELYLYNPENDQENGEVEEEEEDLEEEEEEEICKNIISIYRIVQNKGRHRVICFLI